MIANTPTLTLSTTESPRPDRRKTQPPTLTVERGLRGDERASMSPKPERRFQVFCSKVVPKGQTHLYVHPVLPSGKPDMESVGVLAEVRLYGVGELANNAAIVFMADLADRLVEAGYDP